VYGPFQCVEFGDTRCSIPPEPKCRKSSRTSISHTPYSSGLSLVEIPHPLWEESFDSNASSCQIRQRQVVRHCLSGAFRKTHYYLERSKNLGPFLLCIVRRVVDPSSFYFLGHAVHSRLCGRIIELGSASSHCVMREVKFRFR
jgi:hypothetical protein